MRADCLKSPFRGGKSPQYDGERGMSDLLWLWELAAATPSDLAPLGHDHQRACLHRGAMRRPSERDGF